MTRVKLKCIMGCPGLKSSDQEKGLLRNVNESGFVKKSQEEIIKVVLLTCY